MPSCLYIQIFCILRTPFQTCVLVKSVRLNLLGWIKNIRFSSLWLFREDDLCFFRCLSPQKQKFKANLRSRNLLGKGSSSQNVLDEFVLKWNIIFLQAKSCILTYWKGIQFQTVVQIKKCDLWLKPTTAPPRSVAENSFTNGLV